MEGANVETVKSTKGKDKIYVGGYLYVLDKKLSGGGLAYEREKRRSYGDRAGQCHGRLHAKDGKITKVIREHTHDPQPAREQYYANRNIVDYLRGIAYNIHM